jgi:hypothetical protein
MRLLLTTVAATLALSGCAGFSFGSSVKPIEIMSKPIERTPLALPQPSPLRLNKIEWIVITPQNADAVFARLEANRQTPVLFAVTDQGYMNLAMTMAELRNFINTQRQIIIQYKSYYEPGATVAPVTR